MRSQALRARAASRFARIASAASRALSRSMRPARIERRRNCQSVVVFIVVVGLELTVEALCIFRTWDRHTSRQRRVVALPLEPAWHAPAWREFASFFVPRCRGRNGTGGRRGVVQRHRALRGALPASIRSPDSGGPWGPSATLLPETSLAPWQTCRRHHGRGWTGRQTCRRHHPSCPPRGRHGVGIAGHRVSGCSRSRGGHPLSGPAPEACRASGTPSNPRAGSCLPRPRRVCPPRVISSGIGTSSVPATLTGCGL